jgi:hypothetical protein
MRSELKLAGMCGLAAVLLACAACSPRTATDIEEDVPEPKADVVLPVTRLSAKPTAKEIASVLDLKELDERSPPRWVKAGIYVLAVQCYEDQPAQVRSCLVMKVLREDDGLGRWHLSHLYRRQDAKKLKWQLSSGHITERTDSPDLPLLGRWVLHSIRFKSRPGNKQLLAAMPKFVEGANWKLAGSLVCEENWVAVTGEKPPPVPDKE